MVSFSCEGCNETMVKKKVAPHVNWCRSAVTCIDCSQTFNGQSFKEHNQCISEDEKYQGKLYRQKEKRSGVSTIKDSKEDIPKVDSKDESASNEASKTVAEKKKKHKKDAIKEGVNVSVTKEQSLKKALKELRKQYKLDKKEVLSRLKVTPEGQLMLN